MIDIHGLFDASPSLPGRGTLPPQPSATHVLFVSSVQHIVKISLFVRVHVHYNMLYFNHLAGLKGLVEHRTVALLVRGRGRDLPLY